MQETTEPFPRIEELMLWLAECPRDVSQTHLEPGPKKMVPFAQSSMALLMDAMFSYGNKYKVILLDSIAHDSNYWKFVRLVAWLLNHPMLQNRLVFNAADAHQLLITKIWPLSQEVLAEEIFADDERREELARIVLAHFGCAPRGEAISYAVERLTSIDSVARTSVVKAAEAARQRALAIKKEIEEKARQEAAAKVSRE